MSLHTGLAVGRHALLGEATWCGGKLLRHALPVLLLAHAWADDACPRRWPTNHCGRPTTAAAERVHSAKEAPPRRCAACFSGIVASPASGGAVPSPFQSGGASAAEPPTLPAGFWLAASPEVLARAMLGPLPGVGCVHGTTACCIRINRFSYAVTAPEVLCLTVCLSGRSIVLARG